jgi:hypothetical protein
VILVDGAHSVVTAVEHGEFYVRGRFERQAIRDRLAGRRLGDQTARGILFRRESDAVDRVRDAL